MEEKDKISVELDIKTKTFKEKVEETKNKMDEFDNKVKEAFKTLKEKITMKLDTSELGKLKIKLKELQDSYNKIFYKMHFEDIDLTANEMQSLIDESQMYKEQIAQTESQIARLEKQTNKMTKTSKKSFDSMSKAINNAGKKISKYILSLFSLRTAYSMISRAAQEYLSVDKELSQKIQSAWAGLGAILSPVLEVLANLLIQAVSYINAFVTALTGIDYIAKANEKSLKAQTKATKELQSATIGFDELNMVSNGTIGGVGSSDNNKDAFEPFEVDETTLTTILTTVGAIVTLLDTIGFTAAGLIVGIGAGVIEMFEGVGKAWGSLLNGFKIGIEKFWNGTKEGFKRWWKGITDGITKIIEGWKNGDWDKVWEGVSDIFNGWWESITISGKGFVEGLLNGLQGIGQGFSNTWIAIVNGVITAINWVIRGLNKIEVPDWVPGIGGNKFNFTEIKKVPYFDLPPIELETGAITHKSVVANIGEKGQEAVVPLTNQSAMEQLGKIMGQYVSGGNNNQPIEVTTKLEVDGRTLASIVNKANYESGATLTKGAFAL